MKAMKMLATRLMVMISRYLNYLLMASTKSSRRITESTAL